MHLYQSHLLHNLHITKGIYKWETWGKFADDFCEHLRNVEKKWERFSYTSFAPFWTPKPWLRTLPKTWQSESAVSLYTRETEEAVKPWNKNSSFNSALLIKFPSKRSHLIVLFCKFRRDVCLPYPSSPAFADDSKCRYFHMQASRVKIWIKRNRIFLQPN